MSWGSSVIINSFPAQNILGQLLMDDFGDVLFGILEHTEIRKSRNSSIFQAHPGSLPRLNPHTVFISRKTEPECTSKRRLDKSALITLNLDQPAALLNSAQSSLADMNLLN